MLSNRNTIGKFRDYLRERNIDSTFSNRFLYNTLLGQAKWLIKREENAGKIYKSTTLFQNLKCFPVRLVSTIDEDCGIENCDLIYRTEDKLPECWEDSDGYIIKDVTSIDYSLSFQPISPIIWKSIENNPYHKYDKTLYYYIKDRYIYFPEKAPKAISIMLYAIRDVSNLGYCGKPQECLRFMDDLFRIPPWIEEELYSKALQIVAGITERLKEDAEINKNPNRKGP